MSSIASYARANTKHDPDPRFEGDPDASATGQQHDSNPKKFRLRISQRLHNTAIIAFVSYIILLISFASPYWLSSYGFTDSAFKRLGLWDFCFQNYRHPSYQYDTKFSGCYWIYSPVYTNIRDWLQPPWFMFVQAMTTIALCLASLGLMTISVIFMHFLIQYQLIILSITMVCHLFTTMSLSFGVVTFYLKAFDHSWLMYPEFNHLDWAYLFAVIATFGNGFVTYSYYKEAQLLKTRMLNMKRLIVATNGQSNRGDLDSLDAVYATRSIASFNQPYGQTTQHQQPTRMTPNESNQIYPHFTQV